MIPQILFERLLSNLEKLVLNKPHAIKKLNSLTEFYNLTHLGILWRDIEQITSYKQIDTAKIFSLSHNET